MSGDKTQRRPLDCLAGDYASFLDSMLATARTYQVPDGDFAGTRPLARLGLQEDGNFVVALFRAWAKIADILSFYQERYLNEGFLLTATEDQSFVELGREIGYELSPGIAANVQLSFTVSESPGVPHELVVPAGTRVQSIPPPGADPQVFETLSSQTVRGEWSGVPASPPLRCLNVIKTVPDPTGELVEIHAAGTATGVEPGDCVVLWTETLAKTLPSTPVFVDDSIAPALTQVVPVRTPVSLTRLVWVWSGYKSPADLSTLNAGATPENPLSILTFAQQARVFGYSAPPWNTLPDAVKVLNGGTVGAGLLRSSTNFAAWASLNSGLPVVAQGVAPASALVAASDGSIYAAGVTVYRLSSGGSVFEAVNNSLFPANISCLAEGPPGVILAGASGTVYRSADAGNSWGRLDGGIKLQQNGSNWITVSTALPAVAVRSLVVNGGLIYAGTDQGLYSWDFSPNGWTPVSPTTIPGVIHALAVFDSIVYAGTDQGCFAVQASGTVNAQNTGLPANTAVLSIVVWNGSLVCAGASGAYTWSAKLTSWQALGSGLPNSILSLAASSAQTPSAASLFAVTTTGVYSLTPSSSEWTRVGPILFSIPATASITASLDASAAGADLTAAFSADNMTLPSTATVQVKVAGSSWTVVPNAAGPNYQIFLEAGKLNVYVFSLGATAVASDGTVFTVAPSAGVMETDWPRMTITGGQLDLDDTYPRVVPGSLIMLRQPGSVSGSFQTALFSVLTATEARRDDFWLTGTVTRLTLGIAAAVEGQPAPPQPADFAIRRASVVIVSQICAQAQEPPLSTGADGMRKLTLLLSRVWTQRPNPGHMVLVTGKPAFPDSSTAPPDTSTLASFSESVRKHPSLPAADALNVKFHLDARPRVSTEGRVLPHANISNISPIELSAVRRSLQSAPPVTDLAISMPVSPSPSLDPSTLQLHANIIAATQGETVSREVLGSGDASIAHQRFTLKKSPLITIRPARNSPPQSTLIVSVNQVAWTEVPGFSGRGPADEVFMVRLDSQRRASVIFGDGVEGARLPTGTDNVMATYRVGDPAQGNVAAGSVSNIRGRPLGVHGVTNFAPAQVPQAPETPDTVVRRAPLTTVSLGRLIGLQDYQAFVAQTAGVAQARARFDITRSNLRTVNLPGVIVTVMFDDSGAPLTKAEVVARCKAIEADLRAIQAVPVPVRVEQVQLNDFVVSAQLYLLPGVAESDASAAVNEALTESFSLDVRQIGQNVTAAEVLSVIQTVEGVAGARLKNLQRLLKIEPIVPPMSVSDLIAAPDELLVFAEKTD